MGRALEKEEEEEEGEKEAEDKWEEGRVMQGF